MEIGELRDAVRLAFRARGMHRHVASLPSWDDAFVVHWARLLRVAPHDAHFPLRAAGDVCCGHNGLTTVHVWPGGRLHRCSKCGAAWVVDTR